jgi:hypothetical protein
MVYIRIQDTFECGKPELRRTAPALARHSAVEPVLNAVEPVLNAVEPVLIKGLKPASLHVTMASRMTASGRFAINDIQDNQ